MASGKFHGLMHDEHAAPAMAQDVLLARRPRHRLALAEDAPGLGGVVAAEVHGLADLRDRVVDGLAALVLEQRDERPPLRLHAVGRLVEGGRADRHVGAVPRPERPRGRPHGLRDGPLVGFRQPLGCRPPVRDLALQRREVVA